MKDEKVFSRSHGPPRECAGAMPTLDVDMQDFKYHRIDSRKNNIAIVFLRWAIQATDSTFTGCTAKINGCQKCPGNG